MERFKYLLPEESRGVTVKNVAKLRGIENGLRDIFVKFGYLEALMPSFEYTELYKMLDKSFDEEKYFQYIGKEGQSIALCCDFTIPLARYYVSQDRNDIARYCYFGKVHRKEKQYKGKDSDFLQAGFELINEGGADGENECLDIVIESLPILGIGKLKLELGSAEFFYRVCELAGNTDEITEILNKKNISAMRKFVSENKVDGELGDFLIKLPRLSGDIGILEQAINLVSDKKLKDALNNLKDIYNQMELKEEIIFDLSMVPTMNYYTGMMFKIYSKYAPEPIISGGRYDSLFKTLGKDVPAIGVGYYLNHILKAVEKGGEEDD